MPHGKICLCNPELPLLFLLPCRQIYEVVRPLVSLLCLECTLLQNFEALMALTNLAGISERLRSAPRTVSVQTTKPHSSMCAGS